MKRGEALKIAECTVEEAKNPHCREDATQVRNCGWKFYVDHKERLLQTSKISSCLQKLVQVLLKKRILYAGDYPPVFGLQNWNPHVEHERKNFFWPHMVIDVYQTVNSCKTCRRNRKRLMRDRHLQLHPSSEVLKLIAINIFGPLPRARSRKMFFTVVLVRYLNLTRTILTSETTATHRETFFLENRIVPYGISDFLLTDNGI